MQNAPREGEGEGEGLVRGFFLIKNKTKKRIHVKMKEVCTNESVKLEVFYLCMKMISLQKVAASAARGANR